MVSVFIFTLSVYRMERKELESSKENSKLHERIGELLRSHAEMTDNLKNTIAIPASTPLKPGKKSFHVTSYILLGFVINAFLLISLSYWEVKRWHEMIFYQVSAV